MILGMFSLSLKSFEISFLLIVQFSQNFRIGLQSHFLKDENYLSIMKENNHAVI